MKVCCGWKKCTEAGGKFLERRCNEEVVLGRTRSTDAFLRRGVEIRYVPGIVITRWLCVFGIYPLSPLAAL